MIIKYSNNYSKKEIQFKKKTGLNIIDGFNNKILFKKTVSIIIPVYNNTNKFKKTYISVLKQDIPGPLKKLVEIIVIDDGSSSHKALSQMIKKEKNPFKIKLARLNKNTGRSTARNVGIFLSCGQILLFLDSDTIPNKDWLINHVLRHQYCNNIVTIGFNENITYLDKKVSLIIIKKKVSLLKPNYKKDFRYNQYTPKKWKKIRKDIPSKRFGKKYNIIIESDYFKKFSNNKYFGIWTLPYMLTGSNFGVSKHAIIEAGGFDEDFIGWGMEDTFLGYNLITKGNYLIPILPATAYHIKHNEKPKNRIIDFKRNLKIYLLKLSQPTNKCLNKNWIKEKNSVYTKRISTLSTKIASDKN